MNVCSRGVQQYNREVLLPHVAGPLALGAFAATYNVVAATHGLPTISQGVRYLAGHPAGTLVVGGVVGGLLAHWFLT